MAMVLEICKVNINELNLVLLQVLNAETGIIGIISRLDHFVELGVNILWISPIFKSPMADFGYDISDFTDIDPIFGTIDDFSQLAAAAKAKGS